MDLEPDIFFLSLPGVKAQFFYDRYLNVFFSNQTNIKVSLNLTPNSLVPAMFTVATPDGLIYSFNNYTNCTGGDFYSCDTREQATDVTPVVPPAIQDPRIVNQGSTWHLSKITSPASGEVVSFIYTRSSAIIQTVYSKTVFDSDPAPTASNLAVFKTDLTGFTSITACESCHMVNYITTYNVCPSDSCKKIASKMTQTQVRQISRQPLYLSQIVGTLGTINFLTGARLDMAGGAQQLNKIQVVLNDEKGQNLGTSYSFAYFDFTYGLFQSDNNSSPAGTFYSYNDPQNQGFNGKRLKLLSVQQFSGDRTQSLPPYTLTYNEAVGQNLPYKTSYDIDHWGYYNYQSSIGHNQDLVSIKMVGINRASGPDVVFPAVPIGAANMLSSVQSPLGGYTSFLYESSGAGVRVKLVQKKESANATPMTTSYVYTKNPAYPIIPSYTYQVTSANNLFTGYSCTLPEGYVYNSNTPQHVQQSYFTCLMDAYTSNTPLSFSDLNSVSAMNYSMVTELKGANGELGKTEYYYPLITYTNALQYPFIPLSKNPMDGQLVKMIVYKNVAGVFKKVSLHTFTYTFPAPAVANVKTDGSPPVFDDYVGIKTTSNGIKLGVSFAQVSPVTYAVGYVMTTGKLASKTTATTLFDQADETKITSATNLLENYDNYRQVKESFFNNNASSGLSRYIRTYRQSETMANADPYYHLPFEIVSYRYTGDFATSISKKSYASEYFTWNGSFTLQNKWVSNSLLTTSGNFGSSFYKDASYRQIIANTFDNPSGSGPGVLLNQKNLLTENKTGGYTNTFLSTSTIWGYGNQYPAAIATNAETGYIAFNGFEDGVVPGAKNWNIASDGASAIIVDKQVAGTDPSNIFSGRFSIKVAQMTGSPFPSFKIPYWSFWPNPTTGKYKLSCWVKIPAATGGTNNVTLTIGTSEHADLTYPYTGVGAQASVSPSYTFTDWQYLEVVLDYDKLMASHTGTNKVYIVAQILNNSSFDIYVDDMRFLPLDAQMTTYTYKPGVGKTSEAGPDSKPVHYEYDAFGRLLYVRDFRRNILSKNQYFNKQ
jgi:hypothetical protein